MKIKLSQITFMIEPIYKLRLQITQRNKTTLKGNLTVVQATKHWTTVGEKLASDPTQLQCQRDLQTCRVVNTNAK